MKGFFELLGFASMALISGFLMFTLVGRSNKTPRSDAQELFSENSISDHSGPRELPTISNSKSGSRRATPGRSELKMAQRSEAAKQPTAVNSAEQLRDLYTDQQFVTATVQRWKRAVADANDVHTVRPDVLMSNIIVRSYLGAYSQRDFQQDVAEHAGDCAVSASNALKTYEYGWSMAKLMQQHNLSKYFPAPAAATAARFKPQRRVAEANIFSTKKAAPTAAPKISKPAASTSAAETGFRDMVAKEEGFSSWAGLQKLGGMDTKQNAERRVKRLLSAVRVK